MKISKPVTVQSGLTNHRFIDCCHSICKIHNDHNDVYMVQSLAVTLCECKYDIWITGKKVHYVGSKVNIKAVSTVFQYGPRCIDGCSHWTDCPH